jgi:CubicO group peptidase (beta-lactamase class C family)
MTSVKRVALFCLALFLPIAVEQPAWRAAAQGVNLAGSTVAAQIDKVFTRVDKRDCPGCALGVWTDGQVVYTRGYGMANLEYSVPITKDTVFEAGSVSKQFTAAAILLLTREGKLSLDDDIRKYLPEVPDFGKKITIRHLLTHTSGLRDQWELLTLAGRPPGSAVHTLDEILYLVSRQKELNFPPGEEYLYSNTGYSLLAWIVKRASGRPLAEFSQTEIFHPLGMVHSQWRDDFTRIVKGRATAYRMDGSGAYHTEMPFTNVYGNGGFLTTAGDLLIWSENFFHPRIPGRPLIDEMQTRGKLNSGQTIDYGLGLGIGEYKGVPEISHSGSTAGYRAFLTRFPDQKVAIAILCNLANVEPAALAHQVADILLAGSLHEPEKPKAITVSEEEVKKRVGLYRNMHTDEVFRLLIKEGKLFVAGRGVGVELVPVGQDRFRSLNGQSEVVFDSEGAGKPDTLSLASGRSRPEVYTAVPFATPSPRDLEEYRGDYYSEELDVVYSMELQDGKLTMRHRPEAAIALVPAFADAFSDARGRVIRFTRGNSGKVDGYLVYAGRVRHLRFVKRS